MRTIDADGHVNDYAGGEEISKFMPRGNQTTTIFPVLDHFHWQYLRQHREPMRNPGVKEWDDFLEQAGIEDTVLYPSAEHCRHELDQLLQRDDLTHEDKEGLVGGNATRLYRIA